MRAFTIKCCVHHCFLLFLGMIIYSFGFSQVISPHGNIKNEEGNFLAGVSIIVKGMNNGTSSDEKGNFLLKNVKKGSTLNFSFIGYKNAEILVSDDGPYNVTLKVLQQKLENVVLVGYGSVSTQQVTSAITHVNAEEFNKGNINNPAQLLQGKVPGLSIVGTPGNPNGEFYLRLRGLSTLGANSQPLIVVDGVIGVDLLSVDPNDIATIDVLKDGGAAAIYGTRGSSGVILISTKNGVSGKPRTEYNGYISSESKDRHLPAMDKQTYLANGGTDLGGNTNWLDEITRNAISHVHHLSLSGGMDKTKYMASFNYRNAEGILKNSGFQQLGGRLNLVQKLLDDRITISLNLSSSTRDAELGFDDAFRAAVAMPPTASIFSSDPYFSKYNGYFQSEVHELYNPVGIIQQNINDQKTNRVTYNIKTDVRFTNDINGSVRYARSSENITNGTYISKYSYYGSGVDRNGLASKSDFNTKSDLFEVVGTFNKNLNKIKLVLLGGYSYQNFLSDNFSIQSGNYLTDAFSYNNFSASKDFADGKAISSSNKENNKLIAFFGRLNLNYDNTYFLSASLRREGSSRFGADNKWGNFPGVSASVNINELVNLEKIDLLKVRASYGVTGALPGESYLSQQLYGPGSSPNYFLYNGVFTPVYSPQSNPNSDLRWETKKEIDFGTDFSAFDSRLHGSFDYYNRKTTDALITLNVPVPPNLFPTTVLNAGELKSEGIELALEYQLIKKTNVGWNTRLTYASYNTKVISLSLGDIKYGVREVGSLPAPLTGNTVRVEEGKPIGQMIGWVYEGVDKDGKYIIKDQDNNNIINEKDVAIIGRGLPKGEFGWVNNVTYKRFDLNVFIRGVYGHDLINLNRTMFEQVSRISSYNLIDTKYFDPAYKGPAAFNSYYIENASFVKLDNASLGYNIPLKNNSWAHAMRIYLSGQNLFYITNYSGVDPEPRYTSSDGNVLAPGIEPRNSWVTTRTITFGLNLSL